MSRLRQIKRCPHCGTMAKVETTVCPTCGHIFRTDVYAPQASFNPERTQMLTLPPSVLQAPPAQTATYEPLTYIEPVTHSKRTKGPSITIIVAIVLVLIVGFYVLVH